MRRWKFGSRAWILTRGASSSRIGCARAASWRCRFPGRSYRLDERLARGAQLHCAIRAAAVAHVAAQSVRPDAEAAGAIENAAAPGALVDEAVGGARIGE